MSNATDIIDWTREPTMTIDTLVTGDTYQVPIQVAWEWQIVRKYFDTKPE
jgi:hypothetical protein